MKYRLFFVEKRFCCFVCNIICRILELKTGSGGNNSLSHEHKEEIQVILHKSMDLLTSSIKIKLNL